MHNSECDCIVGMAFILNPEEGAAWLHRHIPRSKAASIPKNDWTRMYRYCPECGTLNPEYKKV